MREFIIVLMRVDKSDDYLGTTDAMHAILFLFTIVINFF